MKRRQLHQRHGQHSAKRRIHHHLQGGQLHITPTAPITIATKATSSSVPVQTATRLNMYPRPPHSDYVKLKMLMMEHDHGLVPAEFRQAAHDVTIAPTFTAGLKAFNHYNHMHGGGLGDYLSKIGSSISSGLKNVSAKVGKHLSSLTPSLKTIGRKIGNTGLALGTKLAKAGASHLAKAGTTIASRLAEHGANYLTTKLQDHVLAPILGDDMAGEVTRETFGNAGQAAREFTKSRLSAMTDENPGCEHYPPAVRSILRTTANSNIKKLRDSRKQFSGMVQKFLNLITIC